MHVAKVDVDVDVGLIDVAKVDVDVDLGLIDVDLRLIDVDLGLIDVADVDVDVDVGLIDVDNDDVRVAGTYVARCCLFGVLALLFVVLGAVLPDVVHIWIDGQSAHIVRTHRL